jgi:hypothetical protein
MRYSTRKGDGYHEPRELHHIVSDMARERPGLRYIDSKHYPEFQARLKLNTPFLPISHRQPVPQFGKTELPY